MKIGNYLLWRPLIGKKAERRQYAVHTRLLAAVFLPGIYAVFCLRLIHAT